MRGNDAALAQSVEADGIIVTDWDHYAKAREIFGPDGIVGLVCENEPQHAADAFDLEADFISIGMKKGGLPSTEALKFWSILSDSPALIEGAVTNDYAAYYVEAGAGFIDASDYIFNHP
jgi:thiamine monophosphate synthase